MRTEKREERGSPLWVWRAGVATSRGALILVDGRVLLQQTLRRLSVDGSHNHTYPSGLLWLVLSWM